MTPKIVAIIGLYVILNVISTPISNFFIKKGETLKISIQPIKNSKKQED
jgi:hypothetical protein